ncbi:MAG: hypothetical protein AB7I37_22210 [Pirellulales bacterium]
MIPRIFMLLALGLMACAFGRALADEPIADEPAAEEADVKETDGKQATIEEKADSLDDELLKSLGEDGDDDVGGLTNKPALDEESDSLDDELMRGLDDADSEEQDGENPLVRIGRQMREVEELIGGEKTGEETQTLQDDIVAQLDKLLKQAQQQQQQQQQNASKDQQQKDKSKRRQVKQPQQQKQQQSKNSPKPSQDSSDKLRPDELQRPDKLAVSDLIKRVWGQLPEKEREQMSQHSIELFLPQYEQLITEYFKALVEKQK